MGSGSSGNCYYIGTASYGFLIDAGVAVRTVKRELKEHGLSFENIWGIFITHDHTDHIKAVGVLGEKYHIPVYVTSEMLNGINRNYRVTEKLVSAYYSQLFQVQYLQQLKLLQTILLFSFFPPSFEKIVYFKFFSKP